MRVEVEEVTLLPGARLVGTRKQVKSTYGFLGEDGTLGNPLNEKRVVVLSRPVSFNRSAIDGY